MRLQQVIMAGRGIDAPGAKPGQKFDKFTDERFELVWNQEAHAISVKNRTNGAVRIVSTFGCESWDPLVAKKEEPAKGGGK